MPRWFSSESAASQPLMHQTDSEDQYESAASHKSECGATTDEEMDSRLSRRSSVLVDILSLFRRSSSVLLRPHSVNTKFLSGGEDDDDEDEEETRNMSKDRILEAIRHKKEIIQKLRCQPWNMKRKRRTLKVAQRHLQRQEAKVSRIRLYKEAASRKLNKAARYFENFKIYLIPWEAKIKQIESHYGSVVSSYFTFLRWTLSVNIIMTIIMLLSVVIPEWLADSRMQFGSERYNRTHIMKVMPEDVRKRADEISTVWDFGGYLQYSLLFYGYYSRETFFGETIKYRVPVAYFLANFFVLGYSFFTILRKMASNARSSKLSSGKTEQYVFNWKAFTGWDYTIGNVDTAGNVHMANIIKFREAIAEYAVKQKKKYKCAQIFLRVLANAVVCCMLAFSVWAIYEVSQIKEADTFLKQNAVSITVSFITLIFPNIFELIGKMENFHPRTALRMQLTRVSILYIANYYTLIFSLMNKMDLLEKERRALETEYLNMNYTTEVLRNSSRVLRQLIPKNITAPTQHSYFSYVLLSTKAPPPTTPAPPKPWTTVFSDFGPFAVSNPKVRLANYTNNNMYNETLVVTQSFGPQLDWNQTTTHLNYTQMRGISYTQQYRLSAYNDLCWETIIGQEITKLVTMDLLMTIAAILVIDFFRGLLCRYCNLWWFWNLEKTFPEYGEFKVAENVLHLVNNQGMIWLGLFFVPLLPFLNNLKLIIIMYIRGWAVMTCNVPARQIFRASRSSNFYLSLLLVMLFLCTIPVGYVIASRRPSKTCGPFGGQPFFYSVITDVLHENLSESIVNMIMYIMSPGIIIPVIVLLLLIIYFLYALIRGLKDANSDLSSQLMHERTEEKKKIFELAGGKKKRDLRFFNKPKPKPPNAESKPVFVPQQSSSDEDTHPKSVSSKSGRPFVPSLGSVSEVDHSDGEEEEHETARSAPKPKLSLKQKILVCIGWSDPKEYVPIEMEDVEQGVRERSEETEEEQEEGEKRSETRYLLPPNRSRTASKERSISNGRSDDEILRESVNKSSSSNHSRRTSEESTSVSRRGIELAERALDTPSSHRGNSKHLETEFISSPPRIITNPVFEMGNARIHSYEKSRSSSGSASLSQSASVPIGDQVDRIEGVEIERTARRLLQPIATSHNARYGMLPQNESGSNLDPTRPPSADGSLSDPSPLPESPFYNSNPHSSYTSAMMSPIMGEILSTDDGTDDEIVRKIRERSSPKAEPQSSPRSSDATKSRAPRFRISMSPPRKRLDTTDSDTSSQRRFEMRVAAPRRISEGDETRPDSREGDNSPTRSPREEQESRSGRRSESPRKPPTHTTV